MLHRRARRRNVLSHILPTIDTHPTVLYTVGAWLFDIRNVLSSSAISNSSSPSSYYDLPGLCNDCSCYNFPSLQRAFDARLKSGWEGLLNLRQIPPIITLRHRGLVIVAKEWREPLDIVVWLQ